MDEGEVLSRTVGGLIEGLDRVGMGLDADLEGFDTDRDRARRDPDLNAQARSRREQELRAELDRQVGEWSTEAQEIRSQIESRIDEALAPSADANVRLAQELAAQRALRALDAGTALEAIVQAASDARDVDLLNGLLRVLPTHFAGAGPDTVANALRLVASKTPGVVQTAFELRQRAEEAMQLVDARRRTAVAVTSGRADGATLARLSLGYAKSDGGSGAH